MKATYLVSLWMLAATVSCAVGRPSSTAPASRAASRPAHGEVSTRASQPAQVRGKGRLFPIQWVNRPDKLPPGVQHHTFHSTCMNCEVGFCVYTPPGYATDDRRYPVIYWLHGLTGNELLGVQHATLLHQAIVDGQVPPMMMVFVNGGRGSMYCDSADGTILPDTMMIMELIPYIDKNYRTIPSREGRAIEGFSMGGFGALKLAFKYPELFCSVVGGAPALADWARMSLYEDITHRIFDDNAKVFEANYPPELVKKNADRIRGKLRIRIVIGGDDSLKRYNDSLCKLLDELGIRYEYEVIEGVSHSRGKIYQAAGVKGFKFQAASFAGR